MTNLNLSRQSIMVAAFAVFGGLAFTSLQANAGVTDNLLHCKANTKQAVVHCCEKEMYQQKQPVWFKESNSSCASIAVCNTKKKSKTIGIAVISMQPKCYIRIIQRGGEGSGPPLQTRKQ